MRRWSPRCTRWDTEPRSARNLAQRGEEGSASVQPRRAAVASFGEVRVQDPVLDQDPAQVLGVLSPVRDAALLGHEDPVLADRLVIREAAPHAVHEVRFVCLEGNESGTYFRGSSRLVGGRAVIDVPEEFRLVREPEGLTVQITPRGRPLRSRSRRRTSSGSSWSERRTCSSTKGSPSHAPKRSPGPSPISRNPLSKRRFRRSSGSPPAGARVTRAEGLESPSAHSGGTALPVDRVVFLLFVATLPCDDSFARDECLEARMASKSA